MVDTVQWDIKFNEVKAMKLSLERELHLHVEEELLVPKDDPLDVDQPQEEIHGVEESTHAEPNIRQGRKHTIESERLKLDATQNVGVPTSQCRQRQSPDRFIGYMALMSKCIMTEPLLLKKKCRSPHGYMPWWRSMTPLSEIVLGRLFQGWWENQW